jgi:hypothetical protein
MAEGGQNEVTANADDIAGSLSRPARVGGEISYGEASGFGLARLMLMALAGLSLAVALAVLVAYLRSPILEMHGFRQTQTAISTYWTLHGGGIINYQTPVTGFPWTIPFEAPVYQLSVAAVNVITPFGLDAAGRLTSFLYLIGAVVLGMRLLADLAPNNRYAGLMFATLMLLSPQYLFWGRTFLVETCAVFFGVALVLAAVRYYRGGGYVYLGVALVASLLCALAKSTSWPAFAAAAGLFWIAEIVSTRKIAWLETGLLVLVAIVSVGATVEWNAFADAQKAKGVFGSALTSANLSDWNFGKLEDRTGSKLWGDVMPTRMLPAALGSLWPVALVAVTHIGRPSRGALIALVSLVLFFVPVMLFTNLHLVHNYYQTANALFLVAAAAAMLGAIAQAGRPIVALGALALLAGGQLLEFKDHYKPLLDQPTRQSPVYIAGMAARQLVPEGRSLYVFGDDWSSEVHYYAQRKGIAFAGWFDATKIREAMAHPETFVRDQPLGGVVDCRGPLLKYDPGLSDDIDAYLVRLETQPGNRTFDLKGGCRIVALAR